MFPTLFHFGHLTLPTFGALAALGLILALALSERTAVLAGVDARKLWDAGIFAVIAAFVVSRVLLAFTYWKTFAAFPVLLLTVPSLTASGVLLTAVATGVWLWIKRVPLLPALDAWAPCAMVVWACLALGHFAEGSDPGVPTTWPWGVRPIMGEAVRVHPVALYAALFAVLLGVGAYLLLQRRLRSGAVAAATLMTAGVGQFLLTFVRQPGMAVGGLDLLEWLGLGMMLAGGALVFRTLRALD